MAKSAIKSKAAKSIKKKQPSKKLTVPAAEATETVNKAITAQKAAKKMDDYIKS
jgi:hypothetical protein